MKKIRALIVDDELVARTRIRRLLQCDPEVEVIGECSDGYAAVSATRERKPDLVFLDVQMPEKDGFDVVSEVGVEEMPLVVFVTAYDHYALRAFQVYALDYLLKPFDEKRFAHTLSRAKERVRGARGAEVNGHLLSLIEELKARFNYLERVMVKTGDRLFFLRTDEIDWIKVEGNYLRLHVGGSSYLLRETLNSLEARLNPEKFLRIHRSAVVNIDRVREVQQMFHGGYKVVLADGTQLPLSRSYREKLPRSAESAC